MFAAAPAIREGSWYDPRAGGGWPTAFAERHIPFTWLSADADLSDIPLLVLDAEYPLDMTLLERLTTYVAGGGSLIVEYAGARFEQPKGEALSTLLGIRCVGQSEFEAHSMGGLSEDISSDLSEVPVLVQGGAYGMQPTTARKLGCLQYPIAPRSADRAIFSFQNPPRSEVSNDPAITVNYYGQGRAIYVACHLGSRAIRKHRNNQIRADPPFMASWQNAWPTRLAANLARFAISRPLPQSKLPLGVGLMVNRQAGHVVVHLLTNDLRPE